MFSLEEENATSSTTFATIISPMRIQFRVTLLATALAAATTLRADFDGYYSFPPSYPTGGEYYHPILASGSTTVSANTCTIASNNDGAYGGQGTPYVFVSGDGGTLTMDAGFLFSGLGHFSTVEVQDIVPAAGTFSFDYHLTLGTVSVSHAYYLINGAQFPLSAGSGSIVNVSLNPGDVFGFGVNAGPSSVPLQWVAQVNLQVTSFAAPVPEPSAALFLGLALAAVVCSRARRYLTRRCSEPLAAPRSSFR